MKQEIIELLKESEGISEEETQMWIDLFPMMEKKHLENLKNILIKEKE
jgi:hypothetical protein